MSFIKPISFYPPDVRNLINRNATTEEFVALKESTSSRSTRAIIEKYLKSNSSNTTNTKRKKSSPPRQSRTKKIKKLEVKPVFAQTNIPNEFSLPAAVFSRRDTDKIKSAFQNLRPSILKREVWEKYKTEVAERGILGQFAICKIGEPFNEGLFLKPDAKPIEKDEFIGLYAGLYKVLDLERALKNSYLFEVCKIDKKEIVVIDAEKEGNFTRYINHTSDENSNAFPAPIKLPDKTVQIGLWASKRILPQEQLLMYYGEEYWKVQDIKPHSLNARTYQLFPENTTVHKK